LPIRPLTRPAPAPHARAARPALLGAAGLAGVLALAGGAQAATFGSLANFDVVNDTGRPAYGFEIEIEDSRFDHPGTITSVFGLDRVFSFVSNDPGAVVRYGKPTVDYLAGFGARITYGGTLGGASTPSAPFTTAGESCWPGANTNWQSTSCDHFGVSTYGSPAKTTYSWLVDNGGALVKQQVGVPAISISYTPPPPPPPVGPPPPPPPPPQMVLKGVDLGAGNQNNAFWVKIVRTELEDAVDLGDLLGGDHPGARPEIAALKNKTETEIEWQVLQPGMVDEVSKSLGSPKASVVYSFAFYRYQGSFDDEGFVDPSAGEFPTGDTLNRYVGAYVGQQIAGFNANEVHAPLPAVPEPQTWALMTAGLGVLALAARRRRARG